MCQGGQKVANGRELSRGRRRVTGLQTRQRIAELSEPLGELQTLLFESLTAIGQGGNR